MRRRFSRVGESNSSVDLSNDQWATHPRRRPLRAPIQQPSKAINHCTDSGSPAPVSTNVSEQITNIDCLSAFDDIIERSENKLYSSKSETRKFLERSGKNIAIQKNHNQGAITDSVKELCRTFDLSPKLAARAVRVLLGESYASPVTLPQAAAVTWRDRTGVDQDLSPIEFMDKYWSFFVENDVLFQADLKRLDESLFEAIKSYCRNHDLPLKDHLPPPSRVKTRRVSSYEDHAVTAGAPVRHRGRHHAAPSTGTAALRLGDG